MPPEIFFADADAATTPEYENGENIRYLRHDATTL